MNQEPKNNTTQNIEMLSRGEAIKKIGGYAALTALGTFMILNPQKAQAQSISEGGYDNTKECQDSICFTGCEGCSGELDEDCNCVPADPPEPFQGNGNTKSNTTNKIDFNPKYNTKYKLKYSKK